MAATATSVVLRPAISDLVRRNGGRFEASLLDATFYDTPTAERLIRERLRNGRR